MRKYLTGVCAILIAGLCLAFTEKKLPPVICQDKSFIWFLVEVGWDIECTNNITQFSPAVLSLIGHETLFGSSSVDPRSELTGQGWLLTQDELRNSGYGCEPPNNIVCAVGYDPIYVTSTSFRKVLIDGIWYWQPKEPWGFGPPLGCYICRPFY